MSSQDPVLLTQNSNDTQSSSVNSQQSSYNHAQTDQNRRGVQPAGQRGVGSGGRRGGRGSRNNNSNNSPRSTQHQPKQHESSNPAETEIATEQPVEQSSRRPAGRGPRQQRGGGTRHHQEKGKTPQRPSNNNELSTNTGDDSTTSTSTSRDPPPPRQRFNKNRPMAQLTEDSTTSQTTSSASGPQTVKSSVHTRHRNIKKLKPDEIKDLQTSLIHGLTTSTYECMVCWDIIRPGHHTWFCSTCYAVFHLGCIQKWASSSLNSVSSQQPITSWRCPGCQHPSTVVPREYFCFCGKVRDPEYNKYITPHSCSQPCQRSRDCPHTCTLPCHPGPCPPCNAMAPVTSCFCGKHEFRLRCSETDYNAPGKSCGEVCGELLGCGSHHCQKECHLGLCPPCTVLESQKCYCGKEERLAPCGSGNPVEKPDGEIGYWECDRECGVPFKCNKHFCTRKCHPLDEEPNECPFDPTTVTTCPCGQTPLTELLDHPRQDCSEPIPLCSLPCSKTLPCGHLCQVKCHHGKCLPCQQQVTISCRCGSTEFTRKCWEVSEAQGGEIPLCERICRTLRNCGKHQCGNKCCPAAHTGEKKGKKKENNSILSSTSNPDGKGSSGAAATAGGTEEDGDVHICPLVCGKKLRCGVHSCQMLCHKGHCLPCLEASFDEISCHCGRTTLIPPISCGQKLPPCRYPCTREPACGHPRLTTHNCHEDPEPCPPCAFLVNRTCVCGKTEIDNVPCHREAPRCGKKCNKLLPCGGHTCQRVCHTGPCSENPDEPFVCTQLCGKLRRCGHPCTDLCHAPSACPERDPCQAMVAAACKCGQLSMELPCGACAESGGKGRERVLPCNDYCAMADRNRRLAVAFDLPADKASTTPNTNAPEYEDHLKQFYLSNAAWAKSIEAMFSEFMVDTSKQALNLQPMKGPNRKFIHEYAAHWRFTTESVDIEPKRSVIVRKRNDSAMPTVLLSVAAYQKPTKVATATSSPLIGPGATTPSSLNTTPSSSSLTLHQLSKPGGPATHNAINALYLSELAFGLTQLELDAELVSILTPHKFYSKWLTEDDAVVVLSNWGGRIEDLESLLLKLRKELKTRFVSSGTARGVECCWVNKTGEVVWPSNKNPFAKKREVVLESAKPIGVGNMFGALEEMDSKDTALPKPEKLDIQGLWITDQQKRSSSPSVGSVAVTEVENKNADGSKATEAEAVQSEPVDDWEELDI